MDFAEAARVYAQQAKLGTASINHAQVVKLRAERKLADLVDEGQERGEIAKQSERSRPSPGEGLPVSHTTSGPTCSPQGGQSGLRATTGELIYQPSAAQFDGGPSLYGR